MAFQIIGPEPGPEANTSTAAPANAPDSYGNEGTPSRRAKKAKARKSPSLSPPASSQATSPSPLPSHSTILEQYRAAKERHPNMLLLFRMGDFYELFAEDAETAHELLVLTLTTRDRTLAMAGFPHHQLESYLHKLLQAGKRVAICDQVEEQGAIHCEVTRIVTPSSVVEDEGKPEKAGGSEEVSHSTKGRSVRQPRPAVLKRFEAWLNETGNAFVTTKDFEATTPDGDFHGGVLDFVVLRGDDKLLVSVRPRLQAKQRQAICDLQKVFGLPYRAVRIWPLEGPNGWTWQEYPVEF